MQRWSTSGIEFLLIMMGKKKDKLDNKLKQNKGE
jgi:hypothetical protein